MAKDKTAPWNQEQDEAEAPAANGMVSMMRSKKEKKKDSGPKLAAEPYEGPDYPYGLSFELRDESLKKLGMKSLPDVGTKMKIYAEVEVTRTSQRAGKDNSDREVGFQITGLCLKGDE